MTNRLPGDNDLAVGFAAAGSFISATSDAEGAFSGFGRVQGVGCTVKNGATNTVAVAIAIGPEFGTVGPEVSKDIRP